SKLKELMKLANEEEADIIALQETKLKSTSAPLHEEGYVTIRRDRPTESNGGGLAFLIRDNIKYDTVKAGASANTELQSVDIHMQNGTITVVNGYHPPHISSLDIDELRNFCNNDHCILTGDLNTQHTQWGCSHANVKGRELSNF